MRNNENVRFVGAIGFGQCLFIQPAYIYYRTVYFGVFIVFRDKIRYRRESQYRSLGNISLDRTGLADSFRHFKKHLSVLNKNKTGMDMRYTKPANWIKNNGS